MVTGIAYFLIALTLVYLGVELASFWFPLAGRLGRRRTAVIPAKAGIQSWQGLDPRFRGDDRQFCVLTACRDGAACIPGFVRSLRRQTIPAHRFRLFLVADHCTDDSAGLARSLGMEVYERPSSTFAGKGNALNDILMQRLCREPFDVLVVLDIDAQVEPDFLQRAGMYFDSAPLVIACATFAKNPLETWLARVGTVIQALLRLHQEGRSALGWDAMLYGSHGYALSRSALERLGWRITTGLVAEDMELRLRCTLEGLPLRYASDLKVYNDVTADARSVYTQRLRWNATYPPLISRYGWPLLREGKWEALFGALLQPTFANLFLYLTFAGALLSGLAWRFSWLRPFAAVAGILWALDVGYFFAAFKTQRIRVGWREVRSFAGHLAIRALALLQSVFWLRAKDWAPAPHPPSREDR